MPYLNEGEWLLINDIVYLINAIHNDVEMRQKFLDTLRTLIPYYCASFYLADRAKDNKLIRPVGVDFDEEKQVSYDQYYYKVDYAKKMYSLSKSTIFRETDLLEDSEREKTEYYNDYLQPRVHFCGSIILANQTGLLGNITLSRTKQQEDFSERELFIMRQLEPHLTNRLYQLKEQSDIVKSKSFLLDTDRLANSYKLTNREIEIIGLMLHGLNNCEISDKLFISSGTVKKHISSIFDKVGVNTRTQLISILINSNEV